MTPSWRRRASCRERVAGEHWASSGRRSARQRPAMLKPGRCKAASRVCSARLNKLRPLRLRPLPGRGWVRRLSARMPAEKVVQTGEVFKITAVAAEQDFMQVGEAVDRLSDGGEGAASRTVPMFYLAVVLESGDVVGGSLDAQNQAEFVVDLDRGFAEAVLDAGTLDPGCELTADLLGELGSDLVAEEGGDVLGLNG